MKKFFLFSTVIVFFFVSSCSKSSPEKHSIVGLWIGTANADVESTAGPLYSSYDIRADSTILVQGLGANGSTYYALGTWSLSGTSFTAQYTTLNLDQKGTVQKATATYNSSTDELSSGTWQNVGTIATGTFNLSKVN